MNKEERLGSTQSGAFSSPPLPSLCASSFTESVFSLNAAFSLRISLSPPPQYFEYTSQKEIRFNTVTELCAEVLEGKLFVGMRHCPGDGESRPPSILWEFRQVRERILPLARLGRLDLTSVQ